MSTFADLPHLIDTLANTPAPVAAFNPYAPDQPHNAIRRANLERYLTALVARQPKVMLLMEAPGYRGCRLTGVPVTSRKILLEGLPGQAFFGAAQGYRVPDEPGFERIQGEQSASIVWGTLGTLGIIPLIWNTYPFHPHQPGQPLTNRAPRASEIALGQPFLQALVQMFQPRQIIAVGNVAYAALTAAGLPAARIRHPAQGGKNAFVAGLTAALHPAGPPPDERL